MRCTLRDALLWAYPDEEAGKVSCGAMEFETARGGTVSAVAMLSGLAPGKRITVRSRSRIAYAPRFFRLVDVPVSANTGPVGFTEGSNERNAHVTRRAPFRVYDAMQPVRSSFRAHGTGEALRIHVSVPEAARPGKRVFRFSVSHCGETCEFHLAVTVHRVRVPSVGARSWPYTNWFSLANMAGRHHLRPWSTAHWRMIGRYARLMVRNRQNTFLVRLEDIFRLHRGRPRLDRDRFRRIVRTFSRAGMHYIEGGHFGSRSTGAWTCPTFKVGLTGVPTASVQGNADIGRMAGQLMHEIRLNGWENRYVQHVADEPIAANAADYRILTGLVRKHMPGIPLVDAVLDDSCPGALDIWCPQEHRYQKDRVYYDALRRDGDRVWFYTCCFPGGPWLNRLLDMELVRPVLLGWGAARFGLDGYLHWGLNEYQEGQDPFKTTVIPGWGGGTHALPPGDTHVVYPGTDGPWSSVRFEAQREGIEDLELLRLLQTKDRKKASALVRSVIRGFDDYTMDIKKLRTARRTLLRELDGA